MKILIINIIITFAIVYIYDIVNFPKEFVARLLTIILKKEVKPLNVKLPKILECSLCATTWVTLILLLIFSPKLCWLSLVFGWSTKHIYSFITIIDKILETIAIKIESKL